MAKKNKKKNGDAPPPPPQPEELTTSALLSLITSPNSADHLAALTIIRIEPRIYIEITPNLNGLFTRSILNTPDAAIRSMAREALITLAGEVARRGDVPIIASLFSPLICNVIASVQDLPTDRADGSCTMLLLTSLASALPQALTPHLAAITNLCHEIIDNSDSEEVSREKAANLLATLCETAPESIPDRNILEIVECMLMMMRKLKGFPIGEDFDIGNDAALGKSSLERVVTSLHERNIVGLCLEQVHKFMQYDDWESREAAVTALEVIGSTGRVVMIQQIVQCLSLALKDTDGRVRKSACKALLTMAPNFERTSTFLNETILSLVSVMGDTTIPRLANSAAKTIHRFLSHCPELLSSSLDDVISHISKNFEKVVVMGKSAERRHQLTHTQLKIVKFLACAAVQDNSSAESLMRKLYLEMNQTSFRLSTDQFESFYDRLINPLKWLLPNKYVFLGAMETLSQMSISIGKSKFSLEASFVLPACAFKLDFLSTEDVPTLLVSLKGMCEILEDECVPFLPLLMPPLIRIAHCSVDDVSMAKQTCSHITLKFIMDQLAINLKAKFAPYVKEVAKVVIDNVKNPGITKSLYTLLSSIQHEGISAVRALWMPYWTEIKNTVNRDCPRSKCWQYLGSAANCLHLLGSEGWTIEEMNEFGEMINEMLEKKMDSGCTEVVFESATAEDMLMRNVHFSIYQLFKFGGPNAINVVHSLLPAVCSSMETSCYGVTIIGYFVLNAPQLAFVHDSPITALILKCLSHENADLRRQGAYALGNVAMTKCPLWNGFLTDTIPVLITEINRPDAMADSNHTWATEKMVAAAAKIIKSSDRIDGVHLKSLIKTFCQWLHFHCVEAYKDEAQFVYDVLSDLIEAKHPLVLGDNNEKCPELMRTTLKALSHRVFDDSTEGKRVKERMVNVARELIALRILSTRGGEVG